MWGVGCGLSRDEEAGEAVHTTSYILPPTHHTLHTTHYTLHATLYTLQPTPYTLSQNNRKSNLWQASKVRLKYRETTLSILRGGADPNRADCAGNTPLHCAADTGQVHRSGVVCVCVCVCV